MPKRRGKEWDHVKVMKVVRNNHQVQCKYCNKQFWITGGNRIRAHLGVGSETGVAKCENVPDEVNRMLKDAESKKTAAQCISTFRMNKIGVTEVASASDQKQPTMANVVCKQMKSEVDVAVARMCYSTGVSFNVVNNKHFREMCSKIATYGATYQPPTDYPIRSSFLQREYETVSHRVDQFHVSYLSETGTDVQ